MSIRVKCPKCSRTIEAKDEWAGKKAQCPNCASVVQFPVPELPDDFLDDVLPEKTQPPMVHIRRQESSNVPEVIRNVPQQEAPQPARHITFTFRIDLPFLFGFFLTFGAVIAILLGAIFYDIYSDWKDDRDLQKLKDRFKEVGQSLHQ
jgi:hypothetical protein